MKKYLLFIISMLCVSIGTWADDGTVVTQPNSTPGKILVTITNDPNCSNVTGGDLIKGNWGHSSDQSQNKVEVVGTISQTGINVIDGLLGANNGMYYNAGKLFDLSGATIDGSLTSLPSTTSPNQGNAKFTQAILPNGTAMPATIADNYEYVYSGCESGGTIHIYVKSGTTSIPQFTDAQKTAASSIVISGSGKNALIETLSEEVKAKLAFDGSAILTTTSSNNLQTQLEAYLISKNVITSSATDAEKSTALAQMTELTVSGPLTSADVTYLSSMTNLATLNLTGVTSFGDGVSRTTIGAAVPAGATVTYPTVSTVSDCTVTLNKSVADADMTSLLAEAKAAVISGGQSGICTLIVNGTLSSTDLASLGDNSMTGATRIDLSGVTLASGASIDYIQLPSSLTQLVLPEDQTVSGTLATKLAAITDLWYAYSPSSDSQKPAASSTGSFDDTKNLIADYVWVNKAGGLAQAFTNEELLRNSFYIKVASEVALNSTDVDFNALTNKPTNYLFLDFSASNLTPAMAANYRVTDQIGYRIILPDNWGVDDLATFAALPSEYIGSLAAVYSYSGTTLKIMEITDGSYMPTALKNPRIVRSGTTAIEVVGKLEQSGGNWYQYGDLGNNLIAALNQADDAPNDNTVNNIKTININVGQANSILTEIDFTNTNIEHFIMSGVKNRNNESTGPGVDVSGCTSLQTIDVSNSTLQLLDAHNLTSLSSVDMSGTLMTDVNGLSGETILTGCTNLTTSGFITNSSTHFKKDLKLINTGLTSFSTAAKVEGDIYLNASTSLTSIDVTSTQFPNSSSVIHIDKTTEETTDALDNLSRTESGTAVKTIMVPNNFASSTRIHPYDEVQNNIQEQAASGEGGKDSDNCYISYDGTTKTATVYTNTAGHLANILATDYALYPAGTTFKFASTSVINENDLKALTGYITKTDNTTNDMNWRDNYYYVDMYDLTATDALCGENGVIGNTIAWLRSNNRQFKGLILPKDQTSHGSGTTLIKDADNANPAKATCSEFIAYYTTGTSATTDEQLVAHIYNQSNTNTAAYQASFDKMKSMLATEVTTDADLYLISTNSQSKIDISSLPTDKTRIETINNEMVGTQIGKASIYVYPDNSGAIKTSVDNTGIEETPTDLLQVNGAMNPDDFTAINSFTNGPRVLDLRNVTSDITKQLLESLTNDHIEYILLPSSMANKTEVCTPDYSDLDGLKAVISSTSTNCVAYVKTAGSLAEARYLATGGSIVDGTSLFSPTKLGLTTVTLAGNLNAADIGCNLTTYHTDTYGHWKNTSGDQASIGLSMETGITSIDLADAVFVNKATDKTTNPVTYADMNLSWAGLANLSDIKLPTNTEMKDIPESCCEGLASLKEICIPHNYEKIHNAAFLNTIVEHITTTDAAGALVDNGPNTYTLSANLKQVGDAPADNNVGLTATQTVFPQNRPVYDCYVLATKTPICYKNAFPANMLYGWGGFRGGDFPYCRDKYVNGTNYYCVLRFPSQESYNAVTNADKKDTSYDLMKKQYTDVTKVYSKKEQTGAVDANGDEITWPTFSELRRAYNQATDGITWNNWVANYDSQQEVNGGENIPTSADGLTLGNYTSADGNANNDLGDYTFENYEGWHQFTLSQATYVEPDEKVVDEKIIREYEDAGWFTICLPYDLTEKQVIEWLGVPQSEGNVICKYDGAEVDASSKIKIPDIRQLTSVTRHTSTGGSDNNKVTFRLTTDLYNNGAPQFMNFDLTAAVGSRYSQQSVNGEGSYTADTKVCLKGGIPYIIHAYKRRDETIKGSNIGQYIMTRYGDQFKQTASCVNHGVKYYEYLGDANDASQKATLKFAKPYEEHQIVAMKDAQEAEYLNYDDNGTPREYRYAFVGQFWNQKLPKYCIYQSKGVWYRNSTDNDYQWSAYKCVIMAVPTITTPNLVGHMHANGNFRNNPSAVGAVEDDKSFYPSIENGSTDKLNGTLKIVFADGRDDDDFPAAAARYSFAFDDDIVEYDDMGNEATAIDKLDGEDITPLPNNYKVYNMSGQYVGNSVNGLAKGMYVVNGKKYVIK